MIGVLGSKFYNINGPIIGVLGPLGHVGVDRKDKS